MSRILAKKTKGTASPPGNGSTRQDGGGDNVPANGCRVDLQAAEVELLLKACQKYRATLPGYLLSAQEEMEIIDELLEKLRTVQDSPSTVQSD